MSVTSTYGPLNDEFCTYVKSLEKTLTKRTSTEPIEEYYGLSLAHALVSEGWDYTSVSQETLQQALEKGNYILHDDILTSAKLKELISKLEVNRLVEVLLAFDEVVRDAVVAKFKEDYEVRRLSYHTYPRWVAYSDFWKEATLQSRRDFFDAYVADSISDTDTPLDWHLAMAGWDYDSTQVFPFIERAVESNEAGNYILPYPDLGTIKGFGQKEELSEKTTQKLPDKIKTT